MTDVIAPMPGTIIEVMVAVGDQVEDEQELMILEAMKMENPIMAPCAGKIAEVKVNSGDAVSVDQVLMVIE